MSQIRPFFACKSLAFLICIIIFLGACLQGTPAADKTLGDSFSEPTDHLPEGSPQQSEPKSKAGLDDDNKDIITPEEPVTVETKPVVSDKAETETQEEEAVKVSSRSGQTRQNGQAAEPGRSKDTPNSTVEPSGSTVALSSNTGRPSDHTSVSTGKGKSVDVKSFNQMVLNIISTYAGKRYPYLLNNDYANYNGVTENIYYQGNLLLKAHPSGNKASHCVGITFEVFYKAMIEWNKLHGDNTGLIKNMSYSQLADMMLTWYVANGPKEISNVAVAVEKYGLGRRIYDLNEARAGDFMDFSRVNGTGHTVVFIGWIKENGRIVGLKYWSSQSATKGIAYNQEYFNVVRSNGKRGKVDINSLYIARVEP